MSTDLLPGTHVVVDGGAIIRRYGSEEEQYTPGLQSGLIIQKWHQNVELGDESLQAVYDDLQQSIGVYYLVLLGMHNQLYLVRSDHMLLPDRMAQGIYHVVTG
jgi:hypothetical protein